MDSNCSALESALAILGQRLELSQETSDIVVVGGAALVLMGYIDRSTADIDVVALIKNGELLTARPLPAKLLHHIAAVGLATGLGPCWINDGPTLLLQHGLPAGFNSRLVVVKYGGLTVHYASRVDQIYFKLYAAVDQGPQSKHFSDLQSLDPSPLELMEGAKWCLTHDRSEVFAQSLRQALNALGINYELD